LRLGSLGLVNKSLSFVMKVFIVLVGVNKYVHGAAARNEEYLMSKESRECPTGKASDDQLSDEIVQLYEQEAMMWKLKGVFHERGVANRTAGQQYRVGSQFEHGK
jgi:hypothetical protein